MMDSQNPTTPARILIVDDHPNTAAMLARLVAKLDKPVEVMTACSGEEAIEIVGDSVVDVLITDFMMPGMSGLDLIEKLKGGREPGYTILMTAYDTPGLALTARRFNVQSYLVKPVQPDKIRDLVMKAIDELHPVRAPQTAEHRLKTTKILIADDYPENVRLLSVRLKSEGFEPITASDGEETLQKCRDEHPELVLLDVNMPKKDGFEVLQEMRADPDLSYIPVIVITAARIGRQDVRHGLNLGADDYITKPFDWPEVVARIRSKLRVKQAEDALRQRNRELNVLPEIGVQISALADLEELSDLIMKRAAEAMGASSAELVVYYPDGGVFDRLFTGDITFTIDGNVNDEGTSSPTSKGLIDQVVSTRQGVVIEDAENDARWVKTPSEVVGSAIAVPLLGRRSVIGVITLTHLEMGHFNPNHLTLLQAIASQAAIAVENVQLFNIEHERVEELVALNTLTRQISLMTRSAELIEKTPHLIRQMMKYHMVAFWLVDRDGRVMLRSTAGAENTIRMSLMIIAPQQAAKTGQPAQISGSIEERTGERAGTGNPPVQSSIAVPMSWNGRISGVLSVHSGKTGVFEESDRVVLETLSAQISSAFERIQLFESVEQEQRRLLAVLRSAADAILVLDSNGKLQLMNPAGERLFKNVEAQADHPIPVGEGYDEILTLLEKSRISRIPVQGEVSWPDKRTFSVHITPVEEGSGQVVILHDVSHFKALDQVKNEFLATTTHDLKNPIFAVMGYNDLLEKAGPLNDIQQDFVGRIRNASRQMQNLVLNLLEMARMDMGVDMIREQLNLADLVAPIVDEFQILAQPKSQNLLWEPGPTCMVKADRNRIEQVVRNLIGNAIKYTPEAGMITISMETGSGNARVNVRDTGIGIPAEDIPHLFERFYRVQDDSTRDIEGSGLGLAIVKGVVERHGGEVQVESVFGQGSCFSFTLPLVTERA